MLARNAGRAPGNAFTPASRPAGLTTRDIFTMADGNGMTQELSFFDLFGFEEPEAVNLTDLNNRNPWQKEKAKAKERKGRGRAQGANPFNSPVNKALNRGRALANSLELQHRKTFGR